MVAWLNHHATDVLVAFGLIGLCGVIAFAVISDRGLPR
jgi:hypothetical protein